MRCLYCGNELALLKKLTGYGEFCSEAHRQKYQEQYNRLALTRLLQAQEGEPERRPPLSRTPVRPSNTLNAGKPRRELDSVRPEESPPPPPVPSPTPPVSADPPGMRGFLPHSFEPALSPTELFSTDPFLAPVTACLPGSGAEPVNAPVANYASPAPSKPPLASKPGGTSRWTLLGLSRPLDLSLERLAGSPLGAASAVPFEFSAEYELTIGQLTCLTDDTATDAQREPESMPAPPAVPVAAKIGRNGSVNGRGSKPPQLLAAPDAALFEPSEGAKPVSSTRPPVVINFAALGIIDPELEPEPESEPELAPVMPVEEVEALPVETAEIAAEVPVALASEPLEPVAPPEIASSVAIEVEPLAEQVPVEEDRSIQEPAMPAERIPLLCSEPAILELRLADAAFSPLDDAQFDAPVFEVQTPTVATCPLRPKVVFGPSPIASASEEVEAAGVNVEPDILVPIPSEDSLPLVEAPAPQVEAPLEIVAPETPAPPAEVLAPAVEGPPKPNIEVLTPEENPKLKSRRRIAELTRKLSQRPMPANEPQGTPEATVVAPPSKPSPVAVEEGVNVSQTERPRALPADLDALRREMERKAAPSYGAPPKSRRIAVLVALVLAIVLLGYLLREAFAAKTDPTGGLARVEVHGPALIAGEGGWSLDWNGENVARQVEVFRPSLTMSDYRFEFQGQIESKALGWMFRAVNPRNYYAMKLELLDVNGAPRATLSKMAIINGEETQRTQTILRTRVRPGVIFKVRTDVVGSIFRTYVQDELVDTWIDDRLRIGGIGLLKDRDELADVRLIQLHELRIVN